MTRSQLVRGGATCLLYTLLLCCLLAEPGYGVPGPESDEESPAPVVSPEPLVLFTIANTNTGSEWSALPYREKYLWKNRDAPCRPFTLKVPDERPHREKITVCIFREHLEFKNDFESFVHPLEVHYDLFEERELKVHGFVKEFNTSTVFGRMVGKVFYGEVSFFDEELQELIVYEVEEINLLTKLLRHDSKLLQHLLYVMSPASGSGSSNKPRSSKERAGGATTGSSKESNNNNNKDQQSLEYNAVVTRGLSLLYFMTNDNPEDKSYKSFLIFSTSRNSYIAPGEPTIKVDEMGRLTFEAQTDSVIIEHDGSVTLSTGPRKYKFRPNGQTILTEGTKVVTLREHEGTVAVVSFSQTMDYDCILPPPSFRVNRKGGFLCRVCLLVDRDFQKYFRTSQSKASALDVLSHVIDSVSWIFRSVDWNLDNVPDNIGLEYDMQVNLWSMNMDDKEFISKDDMDVVFTKLTQMDFSDCCLAIAYTMKAFKEVMFAKSSIINAQSTYPTGMCAVRSTGGVSSNVILISANTREGNYSSMTEEQLIYVTTHEIAKSFGASLDATGKEDCDQFQDETKTIRHYIMWPDLLRNLTSEEKRFSSCTVKNVFTTLSGCRAACFETNLHPFCGNGIIEDGEECDCGSSFSCSKQVCCYPRDGKYPCRKTGVPCKSLGTLSKAPTTTTLTLFTGILLIRTLLQQQYSSRSWLYERFGCSPTV